MTFRGVAFAAPFSFSPVWRTFSPFSCSFRRNRLLPRTFPHFRALFPVIVYFRARFLRFRALSAGIVCFRARFPHFRALFLAGRYASSAKSAFEGQKRGRCDIVMSHEERFPSPNAESALGRNCIGGALGLSLQLSWSGWSGLIWSGVVWSGLVWARLGRSG